MYVDSRRVSGDHMQSGLFSLSILHLKWRSTAYYAEELYGLPIASCTVVQDMGH